jgi:hypothetical protein
VAQTPGSTSFARISRACSRTSSVAPDVLASDLLDRKRAHGLRHVHVFAKDTPSERDPASDAHLAVQAFDMGVNRVRRNAETVCDPGRFLVAKQALNDLGLTLGQPKGSRDEAPGPVGKYRGPERLHESCAARFHRGTRRILDTSTARLALGQGLGSQAQN